MASQDSDKEKSKDEARAREKARDAAENDPVQPSSEKIPEGEGNLRRRADWFQKRTGGTG